MFENINLLSDAERQLLFKNENLSEAAKAGGENELPPKLKHGNGTISKRTRKNKNGTLYTYWQARYFANGRQETVTAKTEAECLKKLKEIREKHTKTEQNGEKRGGKHSDITYGEFLETWLTTYKKPNWEESSYITISGQIRSHVIPKLGKLKLRKITATDIRAFLNGYPAGSTRNKLKIYLKDSFNAATSEPYNLKKNPVAEIKLSKSKEKHHRPLTFAEQQIILDKAEPKDRAAFLFLMCTGLRIGEFLVLNKSDIDFENNVVRINKTLELSTRKIKNYTKTKNDRYVQILPKLLVEINRILNGNEFFGQYSYANLRYRLKIITERNGIKDVSLHSLRSTFASVLHHIGTPYKYVQKWLGHTAADMTLNVYTDLLGKGASQVLDYLRNLKNSLT
jgi:integrase